MMRGLAWNKFRNYSTSTWMTGEFDTRRATVRFAL